MNYINKINIWILALVVLITSSCSIDVMDKSPINLSRLPKYDFNVSKVEVIDLSPKSYVEIPEEVSINYNLNRWAKYNISTVNNSNNIMRITIDNASIIEKNLPVVQKKFSINKENDRQYDVNFSATIAIYTAGEIMPKAEIKVSSNRYQTFYHSETLADKEEMLTDLIRETLLESFKMFDDNVNTYFQEFLR